MNKPVKTVIQIILTAGIIFLAYLVYDSIMQPVRFDKESAARSKKVVGKLKDIRTAELMYKSIHDSYTNSFDSLIKFINQGQIPVVNIIHDPADTTFTKTINDTIAFVNVADSLFRDRDYLVKDIRYIPYTENKEFELKTDTIEKGGVKVHVIEVKTLYEDYLSGLDEQLIINKRKKMVDIEKYPGLKFGSLKEPSVDGNWE